MSSLTLEISNSLISPSPFPWSEFLTLPANLHEWDQKPGAHAAEEENARQFPWDKLPEVRLTWHVIRPAWPGKQQTDFAGTPSNVKGIESQDFLIPYIQPHVLEQIVQTNCSLCINETTYIAINLKSVKN